MILIIVIIHMISKTDNHQRLSKQRTDLELPKISKQNSLENITYQMRYEWLNRSSEYVLLGDEEVQQQHAYLLSELTSLQQESRRLTEDSSRVLTKPLHRSRQANVAQHRERQIENNNYIIWKLKNECDQLQRQASPSSKEGIDAKILEVRDKIAKAKQKIKQLKQKSKAMGDSLENGRDYFEQFKRLEHERDGLQARKLKMQEKAHTNTARLERLMNNLSEIEGDVLYAETYLQQCHESQKSEAAEKTLEGEHRQKSYQIDIIRKTIQSQKSVKQQKYHTLLKSYEADAEKMQILNQKLQNTEIKNLYQKKQILQLEEMLGGLQAAIEEKSRTTGSVEPRLQDIDHLQELRDHPIYRNKQPIKVNLAKNNKNKPSLERQRTMQSSSRTRTTGNYQDPKANRTQILSKPPSQTDTDLSNMMTQPPMPNRGYFRNRKIIDGRTDRNAKTAMDKGEKSVDFIPIQIRQEIQEQSPQKQTIGSNTIEQRQLSKLNTDQHKEKLKDKSSQEIIQSSGQQLYDKVEETIQQGEEIPPASRQVQANSAQILKKQEQRQSVNWTQESIQGANYRTENINQHQIQQNFQAQRQKILLKVSMPQEADGNQEQN